MSLKTEKQSDLFSVSVTELVREDHPYRQILDVVDFAPLYRSYSKLYSKKGAPAIPINQGFKALILQFMENLSDREMERMLAENVAAKLFCGFSLREKTPDHTYFSKLRKRLGTKGVADAFNYVVEALNNKGLYGEFFTFIDATSVISKTALWSERDEAIKAGEEKLDNTNTKKYCADAQAKFGCKGKNKYWYGYKRHVSVDMKSGLIRKVATTPANVSDSKAAKHVMPNQGMVFMDKGYATKEVKQNLKAKGCHDGAIKKNNMKGKNYKKDKWLTRVRMPYECVFSKVNKRARYRGIAKNQFQSFMESLQYNLKRAVKIIELSAQPTG